MTKISKGAKVAAESDSVDQFIEKAAESASKRIKGSRIRQIKEVIKTHKPVCNEWYGMQNPAVLNISVDTLKKLGR